MTDYGNVASKDQMRMFEILCPDLMKNDMIIIYDDILLFFLLMLFCYFYLS